MLRRKLKTSLTLRIFCVTTLILLAASAVTFGIIALATPMTYVTIATDRLQSQSHDLAAALAEIPFEESGPILDRFILDTGASIVITKPDGEVLDTPSSLAATAAQEDGMVVTSVAVSQAASADREGHSLGDVLKEGFSSVSVTTDELSYTVTFQDWTDPCTLYVTPRAERSNPAVEALGRVAPWLLGAMLAFSLLCSVFYARYITRPIVRLSAISKRLAELDFDWTCGETRPDEIGILGRSLDELSRRLSAALDELRRANEALRRDIDRERELERQRLTFFSAASHELKTPLTVLKGQLSGMLEGVDVYRDRDTYLARSLAAARRMEGLIQEILAVTRMEQADCSLRREEVDLGGLVSGQAELLADLAEQRGQFLAVSSAPGVLCRGDRAMLERAVSNLLSNAVLHSPEGAHICVCLGAEDGGAVLTVENGGAHLPEEALPRLFDAFYRVDASRSRATGGSGLGLYLVKMILDRHGAACCVENTQDGVRFTVTFPRQAHA